MANFLTVIHECKDFQAWKRVYDAHASRRAEAGLTELHLLREYDSPNLIALMFSVKDVARALEFGRSPALAEAMKTGGIIGTPRVRFRHGEYKRTQAANYASFTLSVKSFDTAMKAYAMDAADRQAATLTDLAVLQLQEDPNNLLLLWSVTDVARARAFFSSARLAEHMASNAGVIGTPEGHFWKS